MAHLNVKDRVIEAKIVYFGAGLSGKTTNLEQIKRLGQGGKCGELVSLDTDGDRTLFFDWLPFDVGKVNGCDVKMQLYTVPGQPQYAETRRKVLAGSDVVVLILDSQSGAIDRNREVMTDLKESLAANGLSLDETGFVLQLNKRDLPTAMPPADLLEAVGLSGSSYIEAVASSGQGVFETLREATRKALAQVRDAARERTPALRTNGVAGLDGRSLYTALTGDAELPGQTKATIAPSATTPTNATATASAPATPATSPTPRERSETAPRNEPAKNGVHEPVKTHTNGVHGTNGASTSGIARTRDSGRAADVGGSYPSSAQLNEIVAGHRALSRRIDMLERSIEQAVQAALRNVESGVVQKTGEKLGQSLERASGDLRDAMDGSLARQGADLRDAMSDIARRVEEARDPRIEDLSKSQESLRTVLQALKVQMSALHGSSEGRFENLEKAQSGIAAGVEEAKTKLGELDQLGRALQPIAVIEARVATLGDLERRVTELPDGAAFDAMSRRLDGMHAALTRLGEVEKKLQALPDLDLKLRAALPEIDRRLAPLGEIEKKLGTLASLDRRLEHQERDRVTTTTLEARLGTFATVLGSEIDGMLETRFATAREEAKSDRIAVSDAIHRLGKLVAEVSHGLGNRIDALTSQVARVEARTAEIDARAERMAQRLEETCARVDSLSEPITRLGGAVASLEKRVDMHFTESAKTVEEGFSIAHSHIRALNVEVTKSGQVLHRLADDSQKKGWFR
jgi:signal recognition particle receptor subunit beta/uncharacterized protein YoxC